LRPGAVRVPFVAGGQDRLASRPPQQVIRGRGGHGPPQDGREIHDEDENQGNDATPLHCGRPPVSLITHRMHLCPKSTPGPNIIGQAPAITAMPWRRHSSTASAETLDPFAMD